MKLYYFWISQNILCRKCECRRGSCFISSKKHESHVDNSSSFHSWGVQFLLSCWPVTLAFLRLPGSGFTILQGSQTKLSTEPQSSTLRENGTTGMLPSIVHRRKVIPYVSKKDTSKIFIIKDLSIYCHNFKDSDEFS